MSAVANQLIGRVDELGSLEQILQGLDGGRPGAVELVGEPGIGKTRLFRELAQRAERRRCLVLSGSASELERDLPFSIFVDALDEYIEGLEPAQLAALPDDVRTELGKVFPSLSSFERGADSSLQHERYRTYRAVRALLELLAAGGPLVLMLDDVHWADPASVELLAALLRRPPAAAVLMSIALRPRQTPERLSAALERAHRAGVLVRVELGELTPGEARALLGDAIDAAAATALYEESGGNPLYLKQLARSLERTHGAISASSPSAIDIGVPSAVAASITEELALLSEGTRRALEGAAVAGDPFEPELAAAAAATSETVAMEAIDEFLKLDLVRSTDVPRRFRFRHPLVRRAVYEATAAGWRIGAHERCAAALAARGATPAERANHIERSAREGDLEAAALLQEAGETAARLAPASAAHWFGVALRLLPQTTPAPMRIELLLKRASALTGTGHFADGHRTLLEALAIVPSDADALYARVARVCASVESLLGRQEEAGERLELALERLPDRGSGEAAALMIELAVNNFWRARYGVMQVTAEAAVVAAREVGDGALTVGSLAVLALAQSSMQAGEQAASSHSEAARLADSLSDDALARHLDGLVWLAGVELYLDHYPEADAHAGRALTIARTTGQNELYLVLVEILGGVWRQRGKLREAADLLDDGIEAARVLGNTHALIWTLSGRSTIALRMGDLELALATAEESVELSGSSETMHAAEAAVVLAAALFEAGQPQRAEDLLIMSAGGEELARIAGAPRAQCLELLSRCRLALDRQSDAARAAADADAWSSAVQLPMAAAWASRAAAAVALDAGDNVRAAERALASAASAEQAAAPLEAALSRILAGRALALADEQDRAVAELHQASRQLDALGAIRYRDEAERELRKLGRGKHRRTRAGETDTAGVDSLTERELQVAHLVVHRKTNPQIAAELYLSQKTVETHLRNIFRKLNVGSRVELARAVERADRAAQARAQ